MSDLPGFRDKLFLRAYAKINLTLDVFGKRDDGYHDLRSIMQAIALHDTLTFARLRDRSEIVLQVSGEEAEGVPSDEANIAHRAAARLQQIAVERGRIPAAESGLQITLQKSIPSQAGLGGGSSDAAAALRACDSLFQLNLSHQELTSIAAGLGADVPFFLKTGGAALAEGLGERVTRLPNLPEEWSLVVVKPETGVSTAWAYAALDAAAGRIPGRATDRWLAEPSREVLSNDFESVIIPQTPAIAEIYAILLEAPERLADFPPLLCGSGSALFCRTPDAVSAAALAERLEKTKAVKAYATRTMDADEGEECRIK